MGLRDFTVYDVIEGNARKFNCSPAWVFDETRVTFKEYFEDVNCLSSNLIRTGIKKGDRVGILAQNCYEFALLFGAAAKLGAIVLPVNWRLSPDEIEYTIRDCKPKIFFWGNNFISLAREICKSIDFIDKHFVIGGEEKDFVAFSDLFVSREPFEEVPVSSEDPYLIIHTAAVSGKPMGATLSHGNIIAANMQLIAAMRMGEKWAYLNLLPLYHIFGITLAFAVMHAGGKNVITPKFEPETALDLIEKEKISFIGNYPPMLGMLLDKLDEKKYTLASLKYVTGLDNAVNIERLKSKTNAEFLVGYGQSETSGMICCCPYSERPGAAGKEELLTRIKLIDEYDREVERYKPGEICVRGPIVFPGYWNREAENKFTLREGWHHTGDIGRMDKDGYLWYLKRKAEKELIKPGGENVYPSEVEKVVLEHPEVVEVSVIGVPDPEWGEAVKAICVIKPGGRITEKKLIEFVGSRIARYKKPKYVTFVLSLPKSDDGYIDRKRLKELHEKENNT